MLYKQHYYAIVLGAKILHSSVRRYIFHGSDNMLENH